MEPKLVYRALRQISEWTVGGFYSEVHVDGAGNVPNEGPLIVASTHHNEIIDIAVLAITIPHRRHLSFWTKSSLFRNPIAAAILSSSGAIPVTRNPDSHPHPSQPKSTLFKTTSLALHRGEAIGVFPEGTSYTQPRIMQVKSGAVWAAVEYGRWVGDGEGGERVVLIPVAIVYTDKSAYRSRVLVRYGSPISIPIPIFQGQKTNSNPSPCPQQEQEQEQVKNLTRQLESQLVRMSVNAPDWDTLNAAKIARDLLWDGSHGSQGEVPLRDFADVMQILVDLFTTSPPSHSTNQNSDLNKDSLRSEDTPHAQSPERTKHVLVKYLALLYYTNISHSSFTHLFPLSSPSPNSNSSPSSRPTTTTTTTNPHPLPTLRQILLAHLKSNLSFFLHPYLACSLPSVVVVFLPGWVFAWGLGRLVRRVVGRGGKDGVEANGEEEEEEEEEEEGKAQIKSILGGVGIGIGCSFAGWGVLRALIKFGQRGWEYPCPSVRSHSWGGAFRKVVRVLEAFGRILGGAGSSGWMGKLGRFAGVLGVLYTTGWVFVKWHGLFVDGNYKRLRNLLASYKILLGLLPSSDITAEALEPYTILPVPAGNPFIKNGTMAGTGASSSKLSTSTERARDKDKDRKTRRRVSSRKLIRHLWVARVNAVIALREFLYAVEEGESESGKEKVRYLGERGAKVG